MTPKVLTILLVLVGISFLQPVFADDTSSAVKGYLEKGIDWLGGFTKGVLDNTSVDQTYKDKIGSAITDGVPVAKEGINHWFSVHTYIVKLIFNNNPIPIDVGIVSLISMGAMGVGLWYFLKGVFKKIMYAILIIIGIAMFLVFFGTAMPGFQMQ